MIDPKIQEILPLLREIFETPCWIVHADGYLSTIPDSFDGIHTVTHYPGKFRTYREWSDGENHSLTDVFFSREDALKVSHFRKEQHRKNRLTRLPQEISAIQAQLERAQKELAKLQEETQ